MDCISILYYFFLYLFVLTILITFTFFIYVRYRKYIAYKFHRNNVDNINRCVIESNCVDINLAWEQLNLPSACLALASANSSNVDFFTCNDINPSTHVAVFSGTKLVAAVYMWKLFLEKGLSFDTKLSQVLSWNRTDISKDVKLVHFSSMTSGMPCSIIKANIDWWHSPGTVFDYCTYSFEYLGYIVSQLYENNIRSLMNDTLPEGMYFPDNREVLLAGGMMATTQSYLVFLKNLSKNEIFPEEFTNNFTKSMTLQSECTWSNCNPIVQNTSARWQYAHGAWLHDGEIMSSMGLNGYYPYWDMQNNTVGIIAQDGVFDYLRGPMLVVVFGFSLFVLMVSDPCWWNVLCKPIFYSNAPYGADRIGKK